MIYSKFNDTNVKQLLNQLENILEQIGANAGLKFKIGKTKFNDVSIAFTIQAIINNPIVQDKIQEERKAVWEKYCANYGLKKEHWGMSLTINGELFKVTGLNVGSRITPILLKSSHGDTYPISTKVFLRAIEDTEHDHEEIN